jgi:hypothetical protein
VDGTKWIRSSGRIILRLITGKCAERMECGWNKIDQVIWKDNTVTDHREMCCEDGMWMEQNGSGQVEG